MSTNETPRPSDAALIGASIKRAREHLNMSQTALAEAMFNAGHEAWRQTTVSRTEQGSRSLHMAEAETLMEILGESGLWRGTSASLAADGHTKSEIRNLIDKRFDALNEQLAELRDLVGIYDAAIRPRPQTPLPDWAKKLFPGDADDG